jgi:CRP-like cAMP-binding protein
MGLEDDIAVLEQVPALAMLGRQALRILAIGAESRQLPRGGVLFYAGDLADGGYVVQEGAFALEPESLNEGEEIIAGPGTLIGELGLLTATVRTVTATATESTTVIRIPRTLFMKMLEGYPAAAKKMRDVMAARIDGWQNDLAAVQAKLDPERS